MRKLVCSGIWIALAGWVGLSSADEPLFKIYDPGTEAVVDYEKYGEFQQVGTPNYTYLIKDVEGLALASGEGIDPCRSITNNPDYIKAVSEGRLKNLDWWKRVNTSNPQLDYFVWDNAGEDPGIRLLFVGKALEKGKQYIHALKAYQAAMILYPDAACWSAGSEFQWSAAEAAWNAIINLLRKHPELGLKLVGADVTIRGKESGLQVAVNPGKFVRMSLPEETNASSDIAEVDDAVLDAGMTRAAAAVEEFDTNIVGRVFAGNAADVIDQRGTGAVQLVQYGNGEWRMFVKEKPYFIRGMNYSPIQVGRLPWEWNWLWGDENTNGLVDAFEVWVDANQNGKQDDDEPTVSDFRLLKEMGCNTIKLYITDNELPAFNVLALRKMFHETGIRVIVGNFLGAYCHGSGATWDAGTDYTIRRQRENMKASVSNMVMKLKNEPWLLAWVLGNENNMELSGDVNATRTNGSKYPETYSRFLNEVAKMIHTIDPDHPVGTGNLLTGLVEYYGRLAPELDFLGVNSYIGEDGFGATWLKVKQHMNRPVVIAEFGCDSYWTKKGPDEETQATYILKNWEDIVYNSSDHPGAGNSIGGFLFEWVDEWWKDTLNYFEDPPDRQTTRAVFPMPFPDGYAQEEWFGIMGQGAGNQSPYQRVPKASYYSLQKVWLEQAQEQCDKLKSGKEDKRDEDNEQKTVENESVMEMETEQSAEEN